VFRIFNDSRFEAVKGEIVGDFFAGWVLVDVSYASNLKDLFNLPRLHMTK